MDVTTTCDWTSGCRFDTLQHRVSHRNQMVEIVNHRMVSAFSYGYDLLGAAIQAA